MLYLRMLAVVIVVFVTAVPRVGCRGLVTKASTYSVDETLDRLESALKERGLIIFTRLDHAAAAQSMGLKMPRSTVLVHGNPRAGTPRFIQHPTLAIEFPPGPWCGRTRTVKGKWLSYNTSEWVKVLDSRHGAPPANPNAAQGTPR